MSQIPFLPGDKVYGYGRDSGGDEQDLSVAQQEEALRKWCHENGLILTRFFKDEARKGSSTVGRTELQSMMHEFRRACDERGVIVWKYNRFARSVDNAQFLRAEIRTLGYIFHSITDSIPEGPMGRLFEAMIDFKDEQYLIDLSIDIQRGMRDLVEIHKCLPGTPPRGFKRQPYQIGTRRDGSPHMASRWVPDPDLAGKVLQAFQMRSVRASLGQIHKRTHILGSINSYRTFFSNPIYKGTLKYGDLVLEHFFEPMVPPEIWDKVQIVQNGYAHRQHVSSEGTDHPRRANSRFLLSGIAKHAKCGSPMYGHTSKQRNGKEILTYCCTRGTRRRDCDRKQIPKETFEGAVLKKLYEEILTPGHLQAVFQDLRKLQGSRLAKQDAARKEITTDLGKVRRQIKNITDSLKEAGPSRALTASLSDLEFQESDLLSRLAGLDASAEEPVQEIPPELAKRLAGDFKSIYEKADLDTRRMLLRSLIDHVDVEREEKTIRGTIYFYYPPPLKEPDPDPKVPAPAARETVPISRARAGALRYRHIIQFAFIVLVAKKTPR